MLDKCTKYIIYFCTVLQKNENPHVPSRPSCFLPPKSVNNFLLSVHQSSVLFIMASGALFPSMVSGSRGSSSKYLVEFRAGKMTMKGSTVTPDKRKGQVYIQQTDDSLIHFCWKDRTTGNVDDVRQQRFAQDFLPLNVEY